MQALIGQLSRLYFTVLTAEMKRLLWSKVTTEKLLCRTFWTMGVSIKHMFLATKIKPQFCAFRHMMFSKEYVFSLDMHACRFG